MEEYRAKGKLVVVVDWPHLAPSAHHHRQVGSCADLAKGRPRHWATRLANSLTLALPLTSMVVSCKAAACLNISSV
jgi:hypothetical protein